jgi:hypothetical protein
MLATQIPTFAQLPDRRGADRVIVASIIQHTRLLPDRRSQCWPGQMFLKPSRVYGGEER